MGKNSILQDRKTLKAASHATVRSHYFILLFCSLVMIFFGTEFEYAKSGLGDWGWVKEAVNGNFSFGEDGGNILSVGSVLEDIREGRLQEGSEKADELSSQIGQEDEENTAFGHTNGVLAMIVNAASSGQIYVKLAQTLRSILRSDSAVAILFVEASFLWYLVIYLFLKNTYSAAYRRLFLLSRVYPKISYHDILHITEVRRWLKACWVMFARMAYNALWCLTIVGGVIKYFSYFAVPYLVAENPDLEANEAITLSRKMMDGHKMELFRYMLSLWGWFLLSLVTLGISDLVYGVPYRMACYTEFYVRIRKEAIEKQIPGFERLNDVYLYEQADRILLYETYFDVVDEITLIHEDKVELTGFKKNLIEWFGIWPGSLENKEKYEELEGRKFAVARYKDCMLAQTYPQWLSPLWKNRELNRGAQFSFLRTYSVWSLILLFMTFAIAGWSWEVILHFIQEGELVNRGTLLGPWLPIYGSGGVLVLLLCSRFRKNPVKEFFASMTLCGVIEYFAGWFLEMRFHQRWWSYDGYFLNLHGRICAEGLLIFGIGCCLIVYLLAPMLDFQISKLKRPVVVGISLALLLLFSIDTVHSMVSPNMAAGAIEANEVAGETEAVP